MPLTAQFGVRLQGLKDLRDGRRQSSELRVAADLIRKDIEGFLIKRFNIFSKGGGEWPPLAESTVRRKGHSKILIETGDLLKGVKQGLYQRITWSGPWLTITLRMRARRKHKPSGLPIQELIEIHQRGLGRVPKRKVLVGPDSVTRAKVERRLKTAMRKRRA